VYVRSAGLSCADEALDFSGAAETRPQDAAHSRPATSRGDNSLWIGGTGSMALFRELLAQQGQQVLAVAALHQGRGQRPQAVRADEAHAVGHFLDAADL